MAITTKLELRQSHSLVMTPQLQQAIKLLQLSNIELASFVETELERNPLLEKAETDEGSPVATDARPEPAASPFHDEPSSEGDRDVRASVPGETVAIAGAGEVSGGEG
ncbi:MAG: RNA polymerase factor sigma-54, partial [Methyloceanibacter sp.]